VYSKEGMNPIVISSYSGFKLLLIVGFVGVGVKGYLSLI